MASTRQIKSRIRSVRSNRQITKAMELVAASKLRKAQERTLATRKFTDAGIEVLNALADTTDVTHSPLYQVRPVKSRLIIVLTSDRGLAGAYNANALKLLTKQLRDDDAKKISTTVITVGRKGSSFVAKLRDVEARGSYNISDEATPDEIRPILLSIVDMFKKGEVDAVEVITTRFVNSFTQTAEMATLLPAGTQELEGLEKPRTDMLFEPDPEEVLDLFPLGLPYDSSNPPDGIFEYEHGWTGQTDGFGDDSNGVHIPGYNYVNLFAGYRIGERLVNK